MGKEDIVSKLNSDICRNFRNAIDESPTITKEEELSSLYNLSCAVMDRLDTSVNYLNLHWDFPKTEENFMCFMLFACMLSDGIDKIYRSTIGDVPKCNMEKKYFKPYCLRAPAYLSEDECPTDELFFEYIRSISFAHPFGTDRNKSFKHLYGLQVSPWVVVNSQMLSIYNFSEPIGVRIYTSKKDKNDRDLHDIMFSFDALRGFLSEKYKALNEVTNWVSNLSNKTFNKWKKVKINRTKTPSGILREVCDILDSRHQSYYGIQQLLEYIECPLSDKRNKENAKKYREYILASIPDICDCVESLDDEGQYEKERDDTEFNPTGLHQMAHYQLEKIYSYLNEKHAYVSIGSNEEWGLIQAEAFYNEFAK